MITELPVDLRGAAVALWEECGLTRPWNDPHADLERALSNPSSTVLAALSPEGALLGTAMAGYDGHRAWVYYLAVSPSVQGAGLGRSLMAACEEWAVGLGAPKLMLMIRPTNTAVVGFYERLGYTLGDTVVMGRRLDEE